VHRLPGCLASDVPERDVQARQAEDDRAAAAEDVQFLLQLQHQLFDLQRVAAQAHRRQDLIDGDLCGGDDVVAEGLAPTGNTGIGAGLHQQRIRGPPGRAAPRFGVGRAAAAVWDVQQDSFEAK